MEGFLDQSLTLNQPLTQPNRDERFIHRWILFLFLTALGFIAMLYLAAATFLG